MPWHEGDPLTPTNLNTIGGLGSTWFNVRDAAYGAIGNGVANDTAAFVAALSAASAASPIGTVYVPAGTYRISSTLTVPSNVRLIGENRTTAVLQPVSALSNGVVLVQGTSVTVSNLAIIGPNTTYSSNSAADAIALSDGTTTSNVILENINFGYVNGWCVRWHAGVGVPANLVHMSNLIDVNDKQGVLIAGNLVQASVSALGTHLMFENVKGGDALFLDGCHDVLLENSIFFTAATGYGGHLRGDAAAVYITNTEFQSATTIPAVFSEASSNLTPRLTYLVNCQFFDSLNGIDAQLQRATIINCEFNSCHSSAVVLRDPSTYVNIEHCHFQDNNGANVYDVDVVTTGGNCLIAGNQFESNNSGNVRVSTGGVHLLNNLFFTNSGTVVSGTPVGQVGHNFGY